MVKEICYDVKFSLQLGIGRLIKCAMDPPLPPIRSSYQAYSDSYHDTYHPLHGNTFHNTFYNSYRDGDVSACVADSLLFFDLITDML